MTKIIKRCLLLICSLLIAMLTTGCLGENFDECPRPFMITVKALDADQKDITESGAVHNVIIFAFDEEGQIVDAYELSDSQVKGHIPIKIKTEYPGHESLLFEAWGNLDSKVEFSDMKSIQQKHELLVKLKSDNRVAQSPSDLFYGMLEVPIEYGGTELGQPHEIEIRYKVASVIITAKNIHPNDSASDYKFELYESPDTYDDMGNLRGDRVFYSPELVQGSDKQTLTTKIFNTFPTEMGKSYILKVYKNGELLYTFDRSSDGKPFVPKLGCLLNIIVDLSIDLDIKVVVTSWGEVYQTIDY